jgi:rare lipoprotein A
VTLLLAMGAILLSPLLSAASTEAAASTGGASASNSPASSSSSGASNTSTSVSTTTTTAGVLQRANNLVSAAGNGMSLSTRASAMLRGGLTVTGTVPASNAGKIVEIERRGRQTGYAWTPTAHGTIRSDGSFTARWPANHIGQFQIRSVVQSQSGSVARAGDTSPTISTIVYRPSIATNYGPGFYGSRTACGQKLAPTTLGTAHRTLPCGTPVAL